MTWAPRWEACEAPASPWAGSAQRVQVLDQLPLPGEGEGRAGGALEGYLELRAGTGADRMDLGDERGRPA